MYRYIRFYTMIICMIIVLSLAFAQKKTSTAKPKPKVTPKVQVKEEKPVEQKVVIPESDVLAEFTGGVITKKDLEAKITKLPAQVQSRYKTVDGQIQILDMMVVEEVFYQKAKELNVMSMPDVQDKITNSKKHLLVQEFYKRNITDKVNMTEADKQEYFRQNLKDFYIQPYVSISYIQPADETKANQAIKELKKGISFETVFNKYNVNSYAKNLNGKIKNIRENGFIPGLGDDAELDEIIKNTEVDSLQFVGPQKTKTGWSIIQVFERVPGRQRNYLECEPEVDQRLRPKKENETLNKLTSTQMKFFNVVIDSTTLASINLRDPASNKSKEDVKVVTSSEKSLNMTVKDVVDKYIKLSPQEQMMYAKGNGAMQMVTQDLNRTLMYLEALKDDSYNEYLAQNDDFIQSQRYFALMETYKRIVSDEVVVSSADARIYYNDHLSEYTTPSARKIQVIWCKDNKTAVKAHKEFTAAVKKNKPKKIAAIIKKYSVKPQLEILDNLYNNGIVTTIGSDEKLSELIWKTNVEGVSPITQSVRNEILFFKVLEERPPFTKSFTEVESRIIGQLKREFEKDKMEQVKEQLFTQYNLKKYPEKLVIKLSADELFEMADNSARQRKYKDAAVYYDQIIKSYPNGTDDYKAFFMKAFLVSEEIGDKDQGLMLFREFLKRFPTGELNESAQYMIDELEGKHPEIEDVIIDDDFED